MVSYASLFRERSQRFGLNVFDRAIRLGHSYDEILLSCAAISGREISLSDLTESNEAEAMTPLGNVWGQYLSASSLNL